MKYLHMFHRVEHIIILCSLVSSYNYTFSFHHLTEITLNQNVECQFRSYNMHKSTTHHKAVDLVTMSI